MFDLLLRDLKDLIFNQFLFPFEHVHPNTLTLFATLFGILSSYSAFCQYYWSGIILWNMNRIFDGLDGAVARKFGKQSKFGGYLDLFCDFIVYGIVPIGIVSGYDPSFQTLIALAFLQASYHINAVSWLMLSAIIIHEESKEGKSLTSVGRKTTTIPMPTGLIEGFETIVFYNVFLIFPEYSFHLMISFSSLVFITSFQRLYWAYHNL